ncbi:MAG TPA: Gfo/Idh/MocA family oxidoreductase [Verrucomicrobiae bacterium]|jgi:predicted dehydrogenase
MKKLNVGVVGCGYWGPNLIRNFRALGDCKLKMICDLDEKRLAHLKNLYPEVEATTDYKHMLNGAGLDAIVIATAVRTHHPLAKAALLAGKHVFVEKPLAASVAESQEMNAIAQEKGLVLMVGHTFLYSAPVRKIKEIVDRGDIGDIRYINARRLNLGLYQKDINVTWDLAPHDISIVQYILDDLPLSVNCQGTAHVTPGVEDVTTLCLNFKKERTAIIQSSWLDPRKVREMTIVGSKRMIVYDDVAPLEKIRIYDARVETPPRYDTFAEFQYAYHYGDMYVPYVKQEEPLKIECQHFLDCINHSRVPLTSGEKGMELVRILEAASVSLKRGGAPVDFAQQAPARLLPTTNLAIHIQSPAANGNGNGHGTGNGNTNGNGNGHRRGKNGTGRATAIRAAAR